MFGSALPERPTRVVSIHYPGCALLAKIQGKVRLRCAIADDGSYSDVRVIYGHPLLCIDAIENAKRWRFPAVKNGSRPRTVDIDYRFEIRGVRAPEGNADVDVTFELPNTVIVVAPYDGKVPCRVPRPFAR
jgi:TonB family protein